MAGMLGSLLTLILSRVVTFTLSTLTVRLTSVRTFGTVAIDFELYSATMLFLTREGVRLALLKTWHERCLDNYNRNRLSFLAASKSDVILYPDASFVNVALLPSIFCFAVFVVILSFNASSIRSTFSSPSVATDSSGSLDDLYYSTVVTMYAFAAFLETLAEPYIISSLSTSPILLLPSHSPDPALGSTVPTQAIRAKAESLASFLKSVTLLCCIKFLSLAPLLSFGLGQLAYGLTVFITSRFLETRRLASDARVLKIPTTFTANCDPPFDSSATTLALLLTSHSLFKHLLTYADSLSLKFMFDGRSPPSSPLSAALPATAQSDEKGLYAIAQGYGALPLRLLLAPVEELARVRFCKSDGAAAVVSASASEGRGDSKRGRGDGGEVRKKHPDFVMYTSLLKLSLYVALLCAVYLPPFFPSYVLPLLLGGRFSSSPLSSPSSRAALSAFFYVLPLAAVNGMAEAYMHAKQVHLPPSSTPASSRSFLSLLTPFFIPLLSTLSFVSVLLFQAWDPSTSTLNSSLLTASSVVLGNASILFVRGLHASLFVWHRLSPPSLTSDSSARSLLRFACATAPRPAVLLALAGAAAVTRFYVVGDAQLPFAVEDFVKHAVGIGGGSLLFVIVVFWVSEREFRSDLKTLLLGTKEKRE